MSEPGHDTNPDTIHRRIIILGSGCAGLTAALYNARADLSPMVIDGPQPGGQLTITSDVENYPGFPEGIMGPELMDRMRQQAVRFGTEIVNDWVESVDLSKRPFSLKSATSSYTCDALIVSTGASAKWLDIDSEKSLMGRGVSACATCDGFFFKEKDIVVVGGGDTAMEEATFLTKFGKSVTVVHRRDQLRASKIMQEKAEKNPKISFVWDSAVEEVHDVSAAKVTGVTLRNLKTQETRRLECQGLFIAIGHQPNTRLFGDQLELDATGYIRLTGTAPTMTSIEGVFAAGDVADHVYRQAITAAGSGCQAAIDAERWLEAQEG